MSKEDIEILENFANIKCERDKLETNFRGGFKMGDIYFFTQLIPAVRNILNENEANKKRIEELLNSKVGVDLNFDNCIPKAKVEEIIQKLDVDIERNNRTRERIEEDYNGTYVHHIIAYEPEAIKRILEELLKDGGE